MLSVEDAPRTAPPATPEHDVVENYHGRQVHDSYRWLEEAGAPAVEQWIDSQNAYTDAVMSGFRDRSAIHQEKWRFCKTNSGKPNPISKLHWGDGSKRHPLARPRLLAEELDAQHSL